MTAGVIRTIRLAIAGEFVVEGASALIIVG
jgi:hypothetical protein